ncbi:E1 subunit of 2-oxoglutarate dehydrogenase [Chloropicon primus]|nr:E1 subunit of 2-oxoglutarate dehydrogenase [Chloropicon primus]
MATVASLASRWMRRGRPWLLASSSVRLHGTKGSERAATAPDPKTVAQMNDSFLSASSANYVEALEAQHARGDEVEPSWAAFFEATAKLSPQQLSEAYSSSNVSIQGTLRSVETEAKMSRVLAMMQSFENLGHRMANLDPLGLHKPEDLGCLSPEFYGLDPEDPIKALVVPIKGNGMVSMSVDKTVGSLVQELKALYCGNIGYEFSHISNPEMRNWLLKNIQEPSSAWFDKEGKKKILERTAHSVMFEDFLNRKFPATKRFGLDGGWSLIPGMLSMVDTAAELGVEEVSFAMAHRGRLNVLANVLGKPLEQMLNEFTEGVKPQKGEDGEEIYTGYGDVKYHLGTSNPFFKTSAGLPVKLSILSNPSHLEAVAPLAIGKTRAKQHYSKDHDRSKTMCVLLHGDGSHSGQGVVYETYDMSGLPDYTVGGTVHIVVNNQVAYTTDPKFSRSSPYCTDVAKALDAPIFHVNGDDAEAVCRVMELAARWRAAFKTDVVVDLICYRKHGHNEGDEPSFTHPLMYKTISETPDTLFIYSNKLLKEGTVTKQECKTMKDSYNHKLSTALEASKGYEAKDFHWLENVWLGFKSPVQLGRIKTTGVEMPILKELGTAMCKIPEGFNVHRKIKKIYDTRLKAIETGEGIDWGTAEALAFATLLREGNHVRLSGQDVERGTFAHRHAVVHDQKTGERYCPLSHVIEDQEEGAFKVCNSALSEFGVLGFELGYSLVNPNSLIMWEAQFGDFANGAQVIFDQFLSSGEAKWLRQSGLVVLLPHGYDGGGAEHSSARLERFLQMCDEDPFQLPEGALNPDTSDFFEGVHLGTNLQRCNWQVVNCSTPANYFHLLRRQVHREFRKPLIVMSPKNLLKHPKCKDSLDNFDDDAENDRLAQIRFKRVIMDASVTDRAPVPAPEAHVDKVLFCSGQMYYKADAKRQEVGLQDKIHMVRIEQISPFPYDLVLRELRRYPNAKVVWLQEEPKNMGAYAYVMPRMETCMRALGMTVDQPLPYVGRSSSAVPATGFACLHKEEEHAVLEDAMAL